MSWRSLGCETLALWVASCAVLGLSQIAFLVIAVRMNYNVVLVFAASILVAIVAFAYVLFTMPA